MAANGNLTIKERTKIINDVVAELISITEPTNHSLVPPSLQSIIRTLDSVTDTLEETNSANEVCMQY